VKIRIAVSIDPGYLQFMKMREGMMMKKKKKERKKKRENHPRLEK
jgi:hypothetical protein